MVTSLPRTRSLPDRAAPMRTTSPRPAHWSRRSPPPIPTCSSPGPSATAKPTSGSCTRRSLPASGPPSNCGTRRSLLSPQHRLGPRSSPHQCPRHPAVLPHPAGRVRPRAVGPTPPGHLTRRAVQPASFRYGTMPGCPNLRADPPNSSRPHPLSPIRSRGTAAITVRCGPLRIEGAVGPGRTSRARLRRKWSR